MNSYYIYLYVLTAGFQIVGREKANSGQRIVGSHNSESGYPQFCTDSNYDLESGEYEHDVLVDHTSRVNGS